MPDEDQIERRIEIIELKTAIKSNTDMTERTLTMVEGMHKTLHGEGQEVGFIGNTQTKLAVHSKSIFWLRWLTGGIVMSLLSTAFMIIRSKFMS